MSPLRSATWSDDVISRGNKSWLSSGGHLRSAILDFWISLKLHESAAIERKVIKTNTRAKNIKNYWKKSNFCSFLKGIFYFLKKKTTCQKLVVRVTSKSMNTNRPHEIFSRKISEKVVKFQGVFLHIWKVIQVQSRRGHNQTLLHLSV